MDKNKHYYKYTIDIDEKQSWFFNKKRFVGSVWIFPKYFINYEIWPKRVFSKTYFESSLDEVRSELREKARSHMEEDYVPHPERDSSIWSEDIKPE